MMKAKRVGIFFAALAFVLAFPVMSGCKHESDIGGGQQVERPGDDDPGRIQHPDDPGGGQEEYNVVFDTGDGTPVASQKVKNGECIQKPNDPVKRNSAEYDYEFDGWYVDGRKWDFENDAVNGDITLRAKWNASKSSPEYKNGEL